MQHFFVILLIDSIFMSIVFCVEIRVCYSRIWPLLQLPNDQIFGWRRILQFPQLVRWQSLVSIGPHHWRHHLSWSDGDFGQHLPCVAIHSHPDWHPQCLRLFGPIIFQLDDYRHVFADEGVEWLCVRSGGGCHDINRSRIHFAVCRRLLW